METVPAYSVIEKCYDGCGKRPSTAFSVLLLCIGDLLVAEIDDPIYGKDKEIGC